MDDRDKKIILGRRRFFIATAVAGLATTQCESPFRPCLKVAMPVDAAATVPEAAAPVDASSDDASSEATDASVDANGVDAKTSRKPSRTPGPSVCLNPYE
jgi:hypothetical protein